MKWDGRTQYPWEDISNRRENSSSGQEDAEIAYGHGCAGRKEDVSDCSNNREEGDHETSLLESIRDPSSCNCNDEGDEVWRCRETLGVDRGKTHVLEDSGKEDGKRGEADIAAEVHELYTVSYPCCIVTCADILQ